MTIEQVVRMRLVDDGNVTALVGQRIYQLRLPQAPTYPAIRVQLIDEPEFYHLRGTQKLFRARVQVDSYAMEGSGTDPYATANAVAAEVNAALSGALFDDGSPLTIAVTGSFRESRMVLYEPDELRLVRVMQDYTLWFTTMN